MGMMETQEAGEFLVLSIIFLLLHNDAAVWMCMALILPDLSPGLARILCLFPRSGSTIPTSVERDWHSVWLVVWAIIFPVMIANVLIFFSLYVHKDNHSSAMKKWVWEIWKNMFSRALRF